VTQISGTFDSYDSVNFEDLSNVLYNISPTQTPFMSNIGRSKATATFHEWVIESLAAADGTNAVIEADDATIDTGNTGTRVGNRVQISDKAVIVSDTNEWINSPGDNASLAHQLALKTKEIKRDMETILTSNQASVTGSSAVARKLGGYESWITTNDSRATSGTPGADGGFSSGNTAAATDGTQRAFTEALLKAVLKACYDAGGEPDTVSVGSFNKQVASGFPGIATQTKTNTGTGQATILAGADVYVGDFGTVQIVPNRFQRARSALVYDSSMWAVAYGKALHMDELAKTGHAEKRMLTVEYTLEARNEASSGVVADLLTS
jgi:hypothetical protein